MPSAISASTIAFTLAKLASNNGTFPRFLRICSTPSWVKIRLGCSFAESDGMLINTNIISNKLFIILIGMIGSSLRVNVFKNSTLILTGQSKVI